MERLVSIIDNCTDESSVHLFQHLTFSSLWSYLNLNTDMTAIYNAFLKQEIACNDVVVRDTGCADSPELAPSVNAVSGDKRVTLTWTEVNNARSYDVMRAEGGCEKGKVKVANVQSGTGNLRLLTDTGLKNGFEVSVSIKHCFFLKM